ncbi:GntR family transcriptional regulator [Fusobacterium nucleatum]|uniref:GntR family transcriptional regulator n=1 Tax=Fusobacterium nucleatum subsp. polymorphum TaxID=76857 RepID=A0A2C6AXS3_FUSNP|nr:GntR family transcriptional regulator [Fusobacterium polymorphum]PHH96750.1 GntR family transcriptional regulator [Fusobacterium polymorphum]BEO96637.1 GntR family transcriptional regulator [Fusobacterium nucleatum]BEP06658.1 GntR family transcriptional regulator [Fusobacterium nucleatum]
MEKFRIEKKKTLNLQVYEILKEMILNNEFKNEIKLNEVLIASKLEVSPTPVREAFRMLAADGIVEIVPWKGVFIRKYTIKEIEEAYQCREVLETLAVKLCINIIPKTEIDRLLKLLKENHDTVEKRIKVSNEIHNMIIEYSHNKILKNLITQLNDILIYDRRLSAYDGLRGKQIDQEHKLILKALKEKNENAAIFYMKEHIQNGFKYVKENHN